MGYLSAKPTDESVSLSRGLLDQALLSLPLITLSMLRAGSDRRAQMSQLGRRFMGRADRRLQRPDAMARINLFRDAVRSASGIPVGCRQVLNALMQHRLCQRCRLFPPSLRCIGTAIITN